MTLQDILKFVGGSQSSSGWTGLILAVALLIGGMAIGRWACQPTITTVVQPGSIPVPASSDETIVGALRIERDSLRARLALLTKKLDARIHDSSAVRPQALIDSLLALPIEVVPDIEVLQGHAEFTDTTCHRIDSVSVISYGAPLSLIDIQLRRGPGHVEHLDSVQVVTISEGVPWPWAIAVTLAALLTGRFIF